MTVLNPKTRLNPRIDSRLGLGRETRGTAFGAACTGARGTSRGRLAEYLPSRVALPQA